MCRDQKCFSSTPVDVLDICFCFYFVIVGASYCHQSCFSYLLVFVMLVLCHSQLSQDEATTFYDELNHHIFELVSSSDVNEKKGGILAIGKL